jgi:site-specific recombinase XerD
MADELNTTGNTDLTILGGAPPQGTNPAAVYLAGLAPTGRRTMQGALGKIARLCGFDGWESMPWVHLKYEHVQAIRTTLQESGLKAATVNKALAAIRGTMHAAWQMGQVDAEHYARVKAVKTVTGTTLPAGRAVNPGELMAIMRACQDDKTPAGPRDAAIIALLYAGGMRRAEVAALTLGDLTEADGVYTIRVLGKRNKERLVYLDNGGALALGAWLAQRGGDPGALFYAARRGGHLLMGHSMTAQAIHDVVTKRASGAGVVKTSPHDLRRSFVSDLLDAGVDIATVAGMAGHESVETTARYDRRGEASKKKAARSLHVPYGNGTK